MLDNLNNTYPHAVHTLADKPLSNTHPVTANEFGTLILAVDLGTSGCKTAIVDIGKTKHDKANVLAWTFEPCEIFIEGDSAEQDPEHWWQALLTTAKQVLDETGLHAHIQAVSCSCQGENTLPIDEHNQPLMRSISWMDMRGAKHIQAVAGGALAVSGFSPNKIYNWIKFTGGAPALTGKDPSGHMLYIKNERPDIYAKTKTFLNVPDYLVMRLTGKPVASYDSILTSWVTDNRNLQHIHYLKKLIDQLGIDKAKLPHLAPCSKVVGRLTSEVATALGLSKDVAVVAGALDTSACAMGSGQVADNATHLYIGTSSWLAAHTPTKKTDIFKSIAAVPSAHPDRYLMIALQSLAGANLTFLRDNVFFAQDGLSGNAPDDCYQQFDRLAAESPLGAKGLFYLPWLYGERSPVEDKTLRAGFINLTLEHTRADMVRAVMEGVALNTKWLMEPVQVFLGEVLTEIVITGGGGMSELWCQMFADVLNVRIKQPQNPIHVNALGAAFIAGIGIGAMSVDDIPHKVSYKKTYEPNPDHALLYHQKFETYKALYKALQPIYAKLNANQ